MIGLILFALAISHIDMMLPQVFSMLMSPPFFAMSFVPARMTTYLGESSSTSFLKRTSIWDVVCPLMPLPMKLLDVKKSGSFSTQPSVMESPINTAFGLAVTALFDSQYFPKFAQSCAEAATPIRRAMPIKNVFFII